ncbi:MAG: J domain-containing protein [Myxococcales bacterium]
MTELSSALCSVTATRRGRYLWAVWWTGAPSYGPFRKPDASNGGFSSEAEAFAAAEQATGRHLTPIEPYWARAWSRVLRGEAAPAPPEPRTSQPARSYPPGSAWSELGLEPGASQLEIKRAYRRRALETHPDRGGDADSFAKVQRAYERLSARREARRKRGS